MRSRLIFTALLVLVSRPALAREYEVFVGSELSAAHSPSMDAVATDDHHTYFNVGVATSVMPLPFDTALQAEARYVRTGTSATDFGLYDSSLTLNGGELGARVVRTYRRRFSAYARLAAGIMHGSLSVTSTTDAMERARDGAWATSLTGGLGVEAMLLRASPWARDPDLSFGVRVELGYRAVGDMSFDATPDRADDGRAHLTTIAAPLGTIDASGPSIHIDVVGRF